MFRIKNHVAVSKQNVSFKFLECNKGKIFVKKYYNLGSSNTMVDPYTLYGQRIELENRFYQELGYVSCALIVGFSILTLVI